MIVAARESDLLVITQPDHARLAAEILSLWRTGGLPAHPRRDELLFATREHDNGWREEDAAPRVSPTSGRPYTFLDLPAGPRGEVWVRGTARFRGERPYAALLITHHARALLSGRRGATERSDPLATLDELEAELREETGAPARRVAEDYRWLDLADRLSLAACRQTPAGARAHGVRWRFADGLLELEPFPLAGATTFRVPCRRIPDRHYSGDADLGGELAAARWQELSIRLVPGTAGRPGERRQPAGPA